MFAMFASCTPEQASQEELIRSLRASGELMMASMRDLDLDVQVDLAHPNLVKAVGGKQKYREYLGNLADGLSVRLKPTLAEETEVVVSGGRAFGRLHFSMDVPMPSGKVGTMSSYMIAESAVDGSSWTFLDGSGLKGDRKKLARVIDGFPEELDLPEIVGPTFK